MGGQACVLYGAAEFSRDIDLAISADPANLERLQSAVDELEAIVIAVPPFQRQYLEAGQAVHFRCQHPDAFHLRVDVMARMRGLEEFPILWDRRTTVEDIDVLSLQFVCRGVICFLQRQPRLATHCCTRPGAGLGKPSRTIP